MHNPHSQNVTSCACQYMCYLKNVFCDVVSRGVVLTAAKVSKDKIKTRMNGYKALKNTRHYTALHSGRAVTMTKLSLSLSLFNSNDTVLEMKFFC